MPVTSSLLSGSTIDRSPRASTCKRTSSLTAEFAGQPFDMDKILVILNPSHIAAALQAYVTTLSPSSGLRFLTFRSCVDSTY